jgi:hypothetical protein
MYTFTKMSLFFNNKEMKYFGLSIIANNFSHVDYNFKKSQDHKHDTGRQVYICIPARWASREV